MIPSFTLWLRVSFFSPREKEIVKLAVCPRGYFMSRVQIRRMRLHQVPINPG